MFKRTRGFSLIELLVTITVIAILAAIIYVSLDYAAAKARDVQRKEDIQKIGYAVELWYQEMGRDPRCLEGTVIEETASPRIIPSTGDCDEQTEFLDYIRSVIGALPTDPLGPDNPDYYYYYDSAHICRQDADEGDLGGMRVIFAVNLETEQTNQFEYCATQAGNNGGYVYTSVYGGTFPSPGVNGNGNVSKTSPDDPGSQPYVYIPDRW